MAEFNFYGSLKDSVWVLERLTQQGDLSLTPCLNFATRHPSSYHRLDQGLLKALNINRRLFITGPFSRAPLSLREVKGGEYSGTFSIDETRGGPALSITIPMCQQRDDKLWYLAPGDVFYPPEYWDDASNQPVIPTLAVKEAFSAIVGVIKSQFRRVKIHKSVWIGPEALCLLDESKALILIEGKWCSRQGDLVKLNR
jgi:hypothetical protein